MNFSPPKGYKFLLKKEDRSSDDCLGTQPFIPGKNLLIRDEGVNLYYKFDSLEHYEWYYGTSDRLTHEVIPGSFPQRPKWDIDNGCESDFEEIVELIRMLFEELYSIAPELVVCDSSNKDKFSRHIIVADFAFANHMEAEYFNQLLRPTTAPIDHLVDWGVNKSMQNFRTVNSIKNGRRKRIIAGDEIDAWITLCNDCEILPRLIRDGPARNSHNYHLGDNSGNISSETIKIITDLIDPNVWSFDYVDNNMMVFNRIRASRCEICERTHDRADMYVCVFKDDARQFCFRDTGKPKKSITLLQFKKEKIGEEDKQSSLYKNSPIYGIRMPQHKVYYSDHLKMIGKIYDNLGEIKQFIRDTIAVVSNMGAPFYVIKDYNGDVKYSMVKKLSAKIKFIYKIDGETKTCKLSDLVDSMWGEIGVISVKFYPYLIEGPKNNYFNTFQGFRHQYNPKFIVDMNKIRYTLQHILEVISSSDNAVNDYLLNWLAHIIQRPAVKMNMAILLKSDEQGTGKNTLCNILVKHVIGANHGKITDNVDSLLERFNSSMENKLLTIVDELPQYGKLYKESDKLNSIITRENFEIERKGEEKYITDDYNNYIFLTNNEFTIYLSRSDRRILPIDVSNKYARNDEYFTNLRSELNDESGLHLFHWLATRDISNFNPRKIPNTRYKAEMKLDALPLPIKMLVKIVNDDIGNIEQVHWDEGKLLISSDELFGVFMRWCERENIQNAITRDKFIKTISNVTASIGQPERINYKGKRVRGFNIAKEQLITLLNSYIKVDTVIY